MEMKIGAAGSCCMDQSYFRFLFRLARKSKQSGLSKSEKSLAKRNVTYHYDYDYYYHGRQSRGSTGNYVIYKSRKKNTKAKATNKMHNKVIKIHDNNSKRKQILVQSKSKIQKHSYLPRINLC